MEGSRRLIPFFDYTINNGKQEKVLAEKHQAVEIWKKMETLAGKIEMKNAGDTEYLRTSTTYGRIKFEIVEKAFIVMLLGHRGDITGNYDKKRIREALEDYDKLWLEWNRLKNNNPECATVYLPEAFRIDQNGVSGDKENGLGKTIDRYRNL
jgi:hypothetical protein